MKTRKGLKGEDSYSTPPRYGARNAANMLADIGTEIHLALETSGAMGVITAPISDQLVYEAPTKKEAKDKAKKLLNKTRTMAETEHKIMQTEMAPAFFHLSPIRPKNIPSTPDPKKVMDPKTPTKDSVRWNSSFRIWGTRGLTKKIKNIITAKKADQTSNLFFPEEVAVDES